MASRGKSCDGRYIDPADLVPRTPTGRPDPLPATLTDGSLGWGIRRRTGVQGRGGREQPSVSSRREESGRRVARVGLGT